MDSQEFGRPAGLEALFDLSFTRFITVNVIRIIYVLGLAWIGLVWLLMVIGGFAQGGFMGGLLGIMLGTLLAAINLLVLRVWLELIAVIFRIGENTTLIARGTTGTPPYSSTGGFPVGGVEGAAPPATA